MNRPIIVRIPAAPGAPPPEETDRVSLSNLLRAAAWLIEHPERWEEFKDRFGLATAEAALKLAERSVPPEIIAALRTELGL